MDTDISKIKDETERKILTAWTKRKHLIFAFNTNDEGNVYDLYISDNPQVTNETTFDISELLKFKNLEYLNFTCRSIVDFSKFSQLVQLRQLKIFSFFNSENSSVDTTPLQSLVHLKELRVNYIPLQDIHFIKHLKSLQLLELTYAQINDIDFIADLHNLNIIDLSGNNINDVTPIKNLTNLSSINFQNNKIKDISSISGLINLSYIDFSLNEITDLSALTKLTKLESLNLFRNQIESIQELENLPSLQRIILGGNVIEDYTPLTKLKHLQELYLGACFNFFNFSNFSNSSNFSNFFMKIAHKHKLSKLNLSLFKQLPQLKVLDLSQNNISDLKFLHKNTELETLFLQDNGIKDITPLCSLKKLKTLDLRKNKITELPTWLINLKSEIEYSHIELGEINSKLNTISIYDNPLENPPLEIAKLGDQAIRNYLEQIRSYGEETLHEGKILIVGEAGSGKSTLFLKLQNPSLVLPDTTSTLGVNVKEGLRFEADGKEVFANCWDFGGQEIQYNLHQYFITPDALYILVTDNRKQNTQWDYWFHILSLLAKDARVLVVLNQKSSCSEHCDFDASQYANRFKSLRIEKPYNVDFAANDERWEYLQKEIKKEFADLPLINKPVPRPWIELRDILLDLRKSRNYIYLNEFYAKCPRELSEQDCNTALNYFHRLGILLNFHNDENLRDIIFLNPNWITQGLYAAISSKNKDLANGQFTKEWIFKFWEEYENHYNSAEQSYLLRLMLKDNFDICYPIDQHNNTYVIPFLLPKNMPKEAMLDSKGNIGFRIQYPFMPQGIMSRLIVQLHDKIDGQKVWQDGAILKDHDLNCRAQILHSYDAVSGLKYIDLQICEGSSENKKYFLKFIKEKIYHIHDTMYSNLSFTEMIRCNCEKCLDSEDPSYFPRYGEDGIEGYMKAGKKAIECRRLKDRVAIDYLLGNVYSPEEIKAMTMNHDHDISNSISKNHISNSQVNINIINGGTTAENKPLQTNTQTTVPPEKATEGRTKDDDNRADKANTSPNTKLKVINLLVALVAFIVVVAAITKLALLFHENNIGFHWLIATIIGVLLLIPTIWTVAVSPAQISEKGALASFDKVLRKLSVFSMFQKMNN